MERAAFGSRTDSELVQLWREMNKANETMQDINIEVFDSCAITAIVKDLAEYYGTAAAFVALESPDDLKLRARHGISLRSVAHSSIAKHGISRALPIIVENIQAHGRFARDVLATGPPAFSFFAGSPLLIAAGRCVGTLCIMDITCRSFSLQDAEFLDRCAKKVCEIYKPVVVASEFWMLSVTVSSMPSIANYQEDGSGDSEPAWTLDSLPEEFLLEQDSSPGASGSVRTLGSLPEGLSLEQVQTRLLPRRPEMVNGSNSLAACCFNTVSPSV